MLRCFVFGRRGIGFGLGEISGNMSGPWGFGLEHLRDLGFRMWGSAFGLFDGLTF